MIQHIHKQLELLEQSKEWTLQSLEGEKQKSAYRNIVNFRRALKKKYHAIENNPAAAIYGESQVGKSYLISSLLSEEGKPFGIANQGGSCHEFIKEINPIGDGSESTSIVSRFSVNYKPKNRSFPIQAKLLAPSEIALVLCESYYNDIKVDHSLIIEKGKINEEVQSLKDRFKNRKSKQNYLGEDDVLDMQDYFREHFSSKASNILFSSFFEEASLFISSANPAEWKDIFALLWNKNHKITNLFDALITEFAKVNFSSVIYLPVEAVLRKNGTLLDVERLREIYAAPDSNKVEPEYKADTPSLFLAGDQERQALSFKPLLCALTAELVFHQEESILKSKPFLNKTDLLDFPGARGRMNLPENDMNDANISQLLIRGKVAFLFNQYSNAEKISIFMLCAKHEQPAQRSMPQTLTNWINKFIGDSPEKREQFVAAAQIPPLFIIGTFFNTNLEYNPNKDNPDDLYSLTHRWQQRFEKTLEIELLDTKTNDWFYNWTKSTPNFQNIFLLRDFVYSESKSQVFRGFIEHGKELEEINPVNYPDFRKKLRQSFIEYDFVKQHFADPVEAWDEAASMNKDGTKLIIDKLTIAANNINKARREKYIAELNEISQAITDELKRYYHSNDKDVELQKAKSIAGDIQFKLDTAFSADGIKNFGKLMKELMLDESTVLELYRKKIDDIEHRDIVNLDIYSNYRMRVPVKDGDTADTYFKRLCAHYEKTSEEQKENFSQELTSKGIDLEELISGNSDLIKNNAQQLAETLLDYWFAHISLSDKHTIQQILVKDGSAALQEISSMYAKLFKKIHLAEKVAEVIRKHLEGQNRAELPFEIIADLSAEIINRCISTVGFHYFDASELKDLHQANQQNNLGLELIISESTNERTVAELFHKIEDQTDILKSKPEEMKALPSYRNYIAWNNKLKVGFVSVCDIPNYDVAKNEKLGILINDLNNINYN